MPPYGLYSLADTPEELLSGGYGLSSTEFAEDPAFGMLKYNTSFNPAPYTGPFPFQNVFRINEGQYYGDLDFPSFGGVSGYRDTGGIMGIEPVRYSADFDTSYGVANEPDEEQVEYLPGQEPQGIAKLFKTIGDIYGKLPTPMNILRGGLGSLRNLNDRIQQSDFGRSKTLVEYFQKRRERKQAERAREANQAIYESARRQGFTNDRGGFSTDRADDAGTSLGSGQFSPSTSRGRSGY